MSATTELIARGVLFWVKHRPFSKEAKARRQSKRAARKAAKRGEFIQPVKESEMLSNLFSLGALKSKLVWLGIAQIVWSVVQAYLGGTFDAQTLSTAGSGILTILFRAVTNSSLSEK